MYKRNKALLSFLEEIKTFIGDFNDKHTYRDIVLHCKSSSKSLNTKWDLLNRTLSEKIVVQTTDSTDRRECLETIHVQLGIPLSKISEKVKRLGGDRPFHRIDEESAKRIFLQCTTDLEVRAREIDAQGEKITSYTDDNINVVHIVQTLKDFIYELHSVISVLGDVREDLEHINISVGIHGRTLGRYLRTLERQISSMERKYTLSVV